MSGFDINRFVDGIPESWSATHRANERWCPTGSHWLPETSFRTLEHGKLARDCRRCEEKRASALQAKAAAALPMTGVDIDRIHRKLGKVRPMSEEYDKLRVEFNPQCKHDRTSYSIVHCDACIEYTRHLLKLRQEAEIATSAVVVDHKGDIT